MRFIVSTQVVILLLLSLVYGHPNISQKRITTTNAVPSPPEPETIDVIELPLPPVTANESTGGCSYAVNPHGTGCISASWTTSNFQSGNFLPDGKHVTASVVFTGAPASPDSRSIYSGLQLIIVKADGTLFPNGDAFKCITCGIPAKNRFNLTDATDYQYPQAFTDGTRILAGSYIISCGTHQLESPACTPEHVYIYPLRWTVTSDGSGAGGTMRELRKHPDDVHISFNAISVSGGIIDEHAYFARLRFNTSPTTGTPGTPRYDLVNVTRLLDPTGSSMLSADGSNLTINAQAIVVGEARGFNGLGNRLDYIGLNRESCNIDINGVDLETGEVTRVTSDPEYVDPIDPSSDGKWTVIMDTTTENRMMFLAGMRGIPPLVDQLITGAVSSIRNNGVRRFFQPWLIDRYGARYYDDKTRYYQGQQLNAAGDGSDGSINDPNWNGGADPRWSLDGTKIAYFQMLVTAPNCGGSNPLPCPKSTAQGGRTFRLMLATLTSRKPLKWITPSPVSDTIPWGQPYVPGRALPSTSSPLIGNYTLTGQVQGHADVAFIGVNASSTTLRTVAVTYHNYSDDGNNFIFGTEQVTATYPNLTLIHVDWYSNLRSTGINGKSTKMTSSDGFHFEIDVYNNKFYANGTLATTVNGTVYRQPVNGG
ncbi:hypothetical protein N7466_010550 [Penicillium verhagenii]|uniref:uncharacterized protein n=1 Tax=Penicillium verhagenii TaxID=1562060 RepID=UPI002545233E|nr:uncharacterized protein N7466_010550 [Penicillium verhagenii]KAJ5918558.1 hypothetical protein N7466_010550 [Penicillium verhagenii]